MRVVAAGLLLAQLSSSQAAWAHGDVHVEIDALSTQLSARPRSAELRSRRGLLYAKDGDWPAAARDLELAWSLSSEDATVGHDLANALFEAGQPAQAVEVLEEVLRIDPAHSDSYRVRARAQQALGLFAEAELDFDRAVSLRTRAEPGVYLERARMLADLDDAAVERGLAGLSEAVQRLGPLVSLVELAVQLEQQRGRIDAALGWLDQLPRVARTSPKWRARRASLLLELGREQEDRKSVV